MPLHTFAAAPRTLGPQAVDLLPIVALVVLAPLTRPVVEMIRRGGRTSNGNPR